MCSVPLGNSTPAPLMTFGVINADLFSISAWRLKTVPQLMVELILPKIGIKINLLGI